jgi:hypothetical protein
MVYKYEDSKKVDSALIRKKTIIILNSEENNIKFYFDGVEKPDVYDVLKMDMVPEKVSGKDEVYNLVALDPNGKKCNIFIKLSKKNSEDDYLAVWYTDYSWIFIINK